MKETTHEETAAMRSTRAGRSSDALRRKLFVMRSGASLFAVYADEVEATSENSTPTPLPFAPAAVRGVVSQRGRILTLIDPLALLQRANPAGAPADATVPFAPHASRKPALYVVALRGDEQLALSVESIEREVELYDDDETCVAADAPANPLIRRTIRHDTHAVALLDPALLFDAAMQGVERRRRRT